MFVKLLLDWKRTDTKTNEIVLAHTKRLGSPPPERKSRSTSPIPNANKIKSNQTPNSPLRQVSPEGRVLPNLEAIQKVFFEHALNEPKTWLKNKEPKKSVTTSTELPPEIMKENASGLLTQDKKRAEHVFYRLEKMISNASPLVSKRLKLPPLRTTPNTSVSPTRTSISPKRTSTSSITSQGITSQGIASQATSQAARRKSSINVTNSMSSSSNARNNGNHKTKPEKPRFDVLQHKSVQEYTHGKIDEIHECMHETFNKWGYYPRQDHEYTDSEEEGCTTEKSIASSRKVVRACTQSLNLRSARSISGEGNNVTNKRSSALATCNREKVDLLRDTLSDLSLDLKHVDVDDQPPGAPICGKARPSHENLTTFENIFNELCQSRDDIRKVFRPIANGEIPFYSFRNLLLSRWPEESTNALSHTELLRLYYHLTHYGNLSLEMMGDILTLDALDVLLQRDSLPYGKSRPASPSHSVTGTLNVEDSDEEDLESEAHTELPPVKLNKSFVDTSYTHETLRPVHAASEDWVNSPEYKYFQECGKIGKLRPDMPKFIVDRAEDLQLDIDGQDDVQALIVPIGMLNKPVKNFTLNQSIPTGLCELLSSETVTNLLPALENFTILEHSTVNSASFACLSTHLPSMDQLQALKLSGVRIPNDQWAPLTESLKECKSLNELRIADTGLGRDSQLPVTALSEFLEVSSSLRVLDLSYNHFMSEGCKDLANVLPSTNVQELDLSGNCGGFTRVKDDGDQTNMFDHDITTFRIYLQI